MSKELKTVEGLNDYIEMLIEATRMPHELSPTGYTDPQQKQYYLGRRNALLDIQKYIKPTHQESECKIHTMKADDNTCLDCSYVAPITPTPTDLDKARTKFWEKMTELVLEYDLYTFDPNIKQMERELMEAYDTSTALIQAEIVKASIAKLEKAKPIITTQDCHECINTRDFIDSEITALKEGLKK